jgi:formylglycine-generating enzyme required for sulfatase activity
MPYIPMVPGVPLPDPSSFVAPMFDHEIVALPGGPFVMGSSHFEEASPHWTHLSSFSIGTTATTEGQFREVLRCCGNPVSMSHCGNREAPQDRPVTIVTWTDAWRYFLLINAMKRIRLGFPTEAEWEYAARGPAINLLELMEEETIKPSDFVEFVEGRFENFVREIRMGAEIFTNPKDERLQEILQKGQPLYGWRVYGTRSGRLTKEEAWISQREMWDDGIPSMVSADWGPANAYGLKGMTGGVWEWVVESENSMSENGITTYLRGGCATDWHPLYLRASFRNRAKPGDAAFTWGFRVAAAV